MLCPQDSKRCYYEAKASLITSKLLQKFYDKIQRIYFMVVTCRAKEISKSCSIMSISYGFLAYPPFLSKYTLTSNTAAFTVFKTNISSEAIK